MKSRYVLAASLIVTSALVSGCNDNNSPLNPIVTVPTPAPVPAPTPAPAPTPTPMAKISDFVKSLIAMVSGVACNTMLPASLDTLYLIDDMDTTDVSTLAVNCT